jgi:hypothetical protein
MMHVVLFAMIGAFLALFAVAAARADQPVLAIPAAILSLWMLDGSRQAWLRRKRDRAA